MRINIVQTNYDPTDIERLQAVLKNVEGGLTCFPECFALGRSGVETLRYLNKVSEELKGILEAVKKTGKTIILPLIEKHPVMRNRFYNTVHVINNGELIGTYRRVVIHPMEKPFIQSGKEFPIFEFEGTTFGVLVCFEIAFPELTRIIALQGTSIIVVPASVPQESDYLWDARLKARAIDNQLFVVGVNRCGEIENEQYIGRSMVVSPRGDIIYACENREEIASVELDLEEITKERGSEPTFSEFEIVVYDKFLEHFKEERD
jgi:omega-amidase